MSHIHANNTNLQEITSKRLNFTIPKSIDDFKFNNPEIPSKSSSKLHYSVAQEASDGQFPFVCEIRIQHVDGMGFICSGSLIDDDWVLSARHCIEGKSNATVQILLGSADRGEDRESYFVDNCFYPVISDDTELDIVLLHLSNPVTYTEDINYIKIINAFKARTILEGAQVAYLAGWGQTAPGTFSRFLHYTQFRLVSRNELNLGSYYYASRPINQKSQSLGGDSGGPMFIIDKGVPILIGVNVAYITVGDSAVIYQQSTMLSKLLNFIALHVDGLKLNY
ncbi:serine protease 48-like [Chironomus tepperi]|uniref:serine protease 48-like n=1 Tax=Chironomus tepperi TaxID=113505 RepID=UPI00391F1FB4